VTGAKSLALIALLASDSQTIATSYASPSSHLKTTRHWSLIRIE
jgi:hypothetical protein